MSDLLIRRTADISPCGTWRTTLGRFWDDELPPLPFWLLNPFAPRCSLLNGPDKADKE